MASQTLGFRRGTDDCVIRINTSLEGVRKDAYVSARFASAAVPIPEVLDVGRMDEYHAYCISRRARGVRVQDLAEEDADRVAPCVCGVLKAVAASNLDGTNGFGPFDPSGHGAYSSWRGFLLSVADPGTYDWARCAAVVDDGLVGEAAECIRRSADSCPEHRGLIHGDFGACNVLSDGTRITGVIDWDLSMLGDPLYDWANVWFWREEKLRPVRNMGWPLHRERLWCYQLRIGLEEIYRSAIGENPVDLAWLTARCAEVLAQDPRRT